MNHNGETPSTELDRTPLTYNDLKRWSGLLVLLIAAALLAWALKAILLLFAVVFLVAIVLNSIVAFLEKRRIHRGLAVALLALAFVAVFVLALSFLIPSLLTQVDELIRETPAAWNRVQAQVQAFGQRYPSIQQAIPESDKVLDTVGARAGDLLRLLYKSSFRMVGGLFGSVFAVLLLVFVLINPQPLVVRFLTLVPDHHREASRRTLLRLTQQIAAWARGVVINGTISAVTTGLLLWFIGVIWRSEIRFRMHPGGGDKANCEPMGMFNDLVSKIFGHASAAPSATPAPSGTTIQSATAPSGTTPAASAVSPAIAAPTATSDAAARPVQTVDVTAILDELAKKNSEKLDWPGSS